MENQPTLEGQKFTVDNQTKPNCPLSEANTVEEMSSEQKEELKEMALEAKGSNVTPSRSKEKSSGGKKASVPPFQKKTTPPPQPPECQCSPPKKGNSADPIKGNR